MSEFMINGYKLVNNQWVKIPEFNLLLPENESTALHQIIHDKNRAFYYHKIGSWWFRATLNESNFLVWTILHGQTDPYWAIIGSSHPIHRILNLNNTIARTALETAGRCKIPEDKEGPAAPTLGDKDKAPKKSGEEREGEIPVDRGLDPTQEKFLACLIGSFNHYGRFDFNFSISEYSLDELVKLHALLEALRLSRPLTEWQSKIFDVFLITARVGDDTYEQFCDKLTGFIANETREDKLTERIKLLREKIQLILRLVDAKEPDIDKLRAAFLGNDGYAIMASLTEDKVDLLWKLLPYRKEGKFDLALRNSVDQRRYFTIFFILCSNQKWLHMISEPGAIELIQSFLMHDRFDPPCEVGIRCLQWLSTPEIQKESLITLSRKFVSKLSFLHAICKSMIEANLNELFEAVLFDDRIVSELSSEDWDALITWGLPSSQALRIMSTFSEYWEEISERSQVSSLLSHLDADDQIKMLELREPIEICQSNISESLSVLIDALHPRASTELFTNEKRMPLLAQYTDENDLEYVMSRFDEKLMKVKFLIHWCKAKPGRFHSHFPQVYNKLDSEKGEPKPKRVKME